MYEDFKVTDRWTGEELRCLWKGTVVAIATRHADATDIRFSVNGKPVWIAMPNLAWVEQKRRNGHVIRPYSQSTPVLPSKTPAKEAFYGPEQAAQAGLWLRPWPSSATDSHSR